MKNIKFLTETCDPCYAARMRSEIQSGVRRDFGWSGVYRSSRVLPYFWGFTDPMLRDAPGGEFSNADKFSGFPFL